MFNPTTEKLYYSYRGIKKVDFPKWQGWEVINFYKKQNVHVSKIEDQLLDILFENFVLLFNFKELIKDNI